MAECFQLRCYTQYTHKAAIIVQVPLLTRYLTPRNSTILPCECVFVVVIVVAAARSHCLHEKLIHLSFWQTGEQKQSSNSFVGYVSYRICTWMVDLSLLLLLLFIFHLRACRSTNMHRFSSNNNSNYRERECSSFFRSFVHSFISSFSFGSSLIRR